MIKVYWTVLKSSKKELICVLPFIGKKLLQLRTRLVNSIESQLKLKLLSNHHANWIRCSVIKSHLRSALTLFTGRRIVTASFLIIVKHTTTF